MISIALLPSMLTRFTPANLFVTSKEQTEGAIRQIQDDLVKQVDFFTEIGDNIKAQRIKERVEYDIEMIKELGHCSGIENYSRYFDGREAGMRPYCLLDFFPEDYLMVIDESHVSVPQISAMYGGDRAERKILWNMVSDFLQPLTTVRFVSRSFMI